MASTTPFYEYRAPAALLLVGTVAGFLIGRMTSNTPPSTTQSPKAPALTEAGSPKETTLSPPKQEEKAAIPEPESDSDNGEIAEFEGVNEECKLVLVVRTDLGMTKGKIAAQASHATLACYKALLSAPKKPARRRSKSSNSPTMLQRWEYFGQAKIAVQVKSEEELLVLQAKAVSLGLCAKIIHDAGRTQIASGSATCLGVGPGPKSVIDQVTGRLKLL